LILVGRINPLDQCGPNRCAVPFLSIWLIPAERILAPFR
jgi:hypothetical protein